MRELLKLVLIVPLCLIFTAEAKLTVPDAEDVPVLTSQSVHYTACSRTANYFLRAHYKPVAVNDAFADHVLDRYLYFLDYNRSLYTQKEVDAIHTHRDRILRAITYCDLAYPFELYNDSLRRRFNKYSFFVEAVKGDLDLSTHERVEFDRREVPYPASEDEIRALWLSEIKNEYVNQLLNDKSPAEAKQRLRRRYEAALGKLVQTKSEDAFSAFENAFATAIDPHTSYLSPDDSENFNDDINLSLEGIGAVLTSEDEFTVINSLLPGSPAELSRKLKANDRIVGVTQEDGTYEDIIGWRLSDVVKRIKGPKGSKVTLDIEREGTGGAASRTFQVTLVRDRIRLQDREAKGEVKEVNGQKVGVISIKSFYTNLNQDIRREITRLKEEDIKALVIDLRSNGGGLLPEATLSTGLFIKDGPVVQVRDTVGNVIPQVDSDSDVAYDGPLVVLINRLSASSSEIMAAALRDYGRALIVGDTSFGKGTVQQNRPLARVYDFDGSQLGSIHYTIAKFYRITGGSTQLKGVTPDIAFPGLVDDSEIGERSEPFALAWDKINPTPYTGIYNIDAYVPELKRRHEERVAHNLAFSIMREDMDRYLKQKAEGSVTVNLKEREALKKEEDARHLKNVNARLEEMGEKPVKKVGDLPEDFEFPDALLNEAVNIALDFASLIEEHVYKAEGTPEFTRFSLTQTVLPDKAEDEVLDTESQIVSKDPDTGKAPAEAVESQVQ